MVGVLYYDWGADASGTSRSRRSATKRDWLLRQVDKMVPGDMPDFDPA